MKLNCVIKTIRRRKTQIDFNDILKCYENKYGKYTEDIELLKFNMKQYLNYNEFDTSWLDREKYNEFITDEMCKSGLVFNQFWKQTFYKNFRKHLFKEVM